MDGISIDLGPLISAVNSVSRQVSMLSVRMTAVETGVANTQAMVQDVRMTLIDMQKQAKFNAALQRAMTEIIRVRQELDAKFGTHKLVRNNMLGILQASDLKLIKENTISKITEELMLAAPKYWLAPCLIALSAWISNDEALANRAIQEAVKRDKEKTCLLFALICRRNGRQSTCFEWLSEYFKLQNPRCMKRNIIAYLDAYTNGVFGEDKDNLCSEHIEHWMASLKENNDQFDESQKRYWKNYFNSLLQANRMKSDSYEVLKSITVEHEAISGYVDRIIATNCPNGIKASLRSVMDAKIDKQQLVHDIDEQLVLLVTNYDEEEEGLRNEEAYLQLVKEYKGDEEAASARIRAIWQKRKQFEEPVDFATRLSRSIVDPNEPASARKTAIFLLREYIVDAFSEYIQENKDMYPEVINLQIQEPGYGKGSGFMWRGKTTDGSNVEKLKGSLAHQYDEQRDKAMAETKITAGNIWGFIMAGIALIIGIVGFVLGSAFVGILGIVLVVVGVIVGVFGIKKFNRTKASTFDHYNQAKATNLHVLDVAMDARNKANKMVHAFNANEENTRLV